MAVASGVMVICGVDQRSSLGRGSVLKGSVSTTGGLLLNSGDSSSRLVAGGASDSSALDIKALSYMLVRGERALTGCRRLYTPGNSLDIGEENGWSCPSCPPGSGRICLVFLTDSWGEGVIPKRKGALSSFCT